MIAKGNQRSGGAQLATHLLNAHDNERVEVLEVRGSIASDLHGAFTEWHAQSKATSCTQYLYSLSVNPDQRQGHLTRDQYLDFLERAEQRLGLSKQGRAVVFHWKKDKSGEVREHCHAVWSRIDATAGRAVNLAHDRMKLRSVAQEFAMAHDRKLPPGLQKDRGPQRHDARTGHADLHEKQQEERTGITKPERMAALTKAWQTTATGKDFADAIQNAGYVLARGDKRSYVVIDRAGEIHALARQIEGVKTAVIKDRLAVSHPMDRLPSVEEAQAEIAGRRERLRAMMPAKQTAPPPANTDTRPPKPDERRAALMARQTIRRQPLEEARAQMLQRHAAERQALTSDQRLTASFAQARTRRPHSLGAIMRRAVNKVQERRQDKNMDRRHKAEAKELNRQARNMTALDKRERHSLEVHIKRDDFQKLAQEIKRRDAVMERPSVNRPPDRPLDRQADRQPDRSGDRQPSMPAFDRRSRLQAVFAAEKTPSLPQPTREERTSAFRAEFRDAATPEPAETERGAAEAERQRELERQRLEALRHER
jgi:hypothetical protein